MAMVFKKILTQSEAEPSIAHQNARAKTGSSAVPHKAMVKTTHVWRTKTCSSASGLRVQGRGYMVAF